MMNLFIRRVIKIKYYEKKNLKEIYSGKMLKLLNANVIDEEFKREIKRFGKVVKEYLKKKNLKVR